MLTRRTHARPNLLTAAVLACLPLLASGCVFGDADSPETPAPSPTSPARPAISRGVDGPTPTPQARPAGRQTQTPQPARGPIEGQVSVVYSFAFIWPAEGPITSFMSPEHPNGIDIGLENSPNNLEVRAAAGGTVSEAGGTDEDALGISIVIDHGNGVTSTYGHLSELFVAEGDEVEIGDVIAIGGSTGISTGEHLHFEVRKDGETVDPLHVLPAEEADTLAFDVDCVTTPFTLPAGAQALLDFTGVLAEDEKLAGVTAAALSGGPAIEPTVEGRSHVLLGSAINFHGPDGLDSYDLEVTVESDGEERALGCAFAVEQREVPTTFYVRAFTPSDDVAIGEDAGLVVATEVPAPTPTPTPNPWAQTPDYEVSSPSGAGSKPPSYSGPAGGSANAQSPSYGIPGATATPAPATATPEPPSPTPEE
jgi:hypothetical protein